MAIGCVLAIRARPDAIDAALDTAHGGVREGLAWARHQPWFWATLVMAALGIMLTLGPIEVLLPYVVRNDLDAPASAFGLVLAAGGVGGIAGGLQMSRRGMPRRPLRFTYLWWGLAVALVAGYAVATAVWQLAALTFFYGVGISSGMVVWATLMQTRVPKAMLGRVSALDWAVSIGLPPISFALTGPVAAVAGTDATLVGGGSAPLTSELAELLELARLEPELTIEQARRLGPELRTDMLRHARTRARHQHQVDREAFQQQLADTPAEPASRRQIGE